MSASYDHAADIFAVAAKLSATGSSYALVVVRRVTGGAMRAPGAVMLVQPDGTAHGYVSNGCVDSDITAQAKTALSSGQSLTLIYGEDSPFRDIVLPCGGSISVVILPNPKPDVIATIHKALNVSRDAITVSIGKAGLQVGGGPDGAITYTPKLWLRLAGRGGGLRALADQAQSSGFKVSVFAPDDERDHFKGYDFRVLISPDHPPAACDDAWTAVVTLFHDHDWELHLLKSALAGPAFYVGAMGSTRTHEVRCETLSAMDLSAAHIAKIKAPIGLIPAMRDANLLALSILAQIVSEAQRLGRL